MSDSRFSAAQSCEFRRMMDTIHKMRSYQTALALELGCFKWEDACAVSAELERCSLKLQESCRIMIELHDECSSLHPSLPLTMATPDKQDW